MEETEWVPTVDDLRVKLCYICREEERYDNPEEPPRAWTHPCNCTLVAHESCLLQWIIAAQQTPDRAANALKCPQCGAEYELESRNPPILKFLDAWNKGMSRVGRVVTVSIAGVVFIAIGSGLYAVCTSYGAFAMREFIGKDLYDQIMTDDPAKWPWYAFINLPLIPLSLINSRGGFFLNISPLVPLLSGWPYAGPVSDPSQNGFLARLTGSARDNHQWPPHKLSWWPPSPGLVCALFPVVRAAYQTARRRLTRAVMKANVDAPALRLWATNDDGDALLRIRVQGEPRAEPAAAPAPAAEGEQVEQIHDPNENAGVAAERTIRLSGGSLGRLVGGALAMPTVSRVMGALLLRASRFVPLLRRVLAAHPATGNPAWNAPTVLADGVEWEGKTSAERLGLVLRRSWMGSRLWLESDPVWWRNLLGLGVFIVAKDCVKLLHLWLAKQELESRHVKNRSFAGVDVTGLDLINPLQRASSPS